MKFLWIGIGIVGSFAVLLIIGSLRAASARRSGLLPAGQATMVDVERLARAGKHIHAIQCYREIHHCGLAEAKKAVENLLVA